MKSKFKLFLVFLIYIFYSNFIFTQTKGSIGSLTEDGIISENNSFIWDIHLLPGVSYTGWWYFWSNSGPMTANLQENPPVSWLSTFPQTFTSNSCSDIKTVAYSFTTPTSPGTYTVTIIDANNNWDQMNITLTVTNSPTINIYDSLVTGYAGQNTFRYQTSSYFPFNQGCNPSYIPGPTRQTVHTLIPVVNWLNINPSNFTLNINNSLTVVKTYNSNTPGTYSVLEMRTRQWSTDPMFVYWTYNAIPPNSITKISEIIPKKYSLSQNYPNPFNPNTSIEFSLPAAANTKLVIYDQLGREIEVLARELLNAGTYRVDWNADSYASGLYFYRLITDDFTITKKMLLIR